MPPRRETIAIPGQSLMIQVTDDQSRTLVFAESDVAYHSGSGAAAETRHVYLHNSGVAARLESGTPTSVLEIGLGTGLGMLMTVDAAIASNTFLRFTSVECRVLGCEILSCLDLGRNLKNPELVDSFLQWRDSLGVTVSPGRYRWQPRPDQEVWLISGDARKLEWPGDDLVDAIYFDPFAPSENPELWQPDFLRRLIELLHVDGRLVTYCVNRQVRESFAAAGFSVSKVRGPSGGKREVMIATRGDSKSSSDNSGPARRSSISQSQIDRGNDSHVR